MKTKQIYKSLETLKENPANPRAIYNEDALIPSILERGLDTRIMVQPDGTIIRGHRRLRALQKISDSEQFSKLFAKGIPVIEVSDATDKELATLMIDSGNTLQLSHPFEVQLAANHLFRVGYTESEVANTLATLLDVVNPPSLKKRQSLQEIRAKSEKAYEKAYAEFRRGKVQGLKKTYNCPNLVMAARRAACEQAPGYPKLTDRHIETLAAAHLEDMGDTDKNGVPIYNKKTTGPLFGAAWKRIIDKQAEPDTPKVRALGMAKLEKAFNSVQSTSLKTVYNQCMGKPVDNGAIDVIDTDLFIVESIKSLDAMAWDAIVSTVENNPSTE